MFKKLTQLVFFILCIHPLLFTQIRLPRLISDGAVFQREKEMKIWGWADTKEKLSLSFKDKIYKTRADESGNWEIMLPAQKAGGPYTLYFKGKNEITVKDIYIGDVWFCSGQSNMVINMERVKEKYPDDIAKANYPEIRNFFIPTLTELNGPKADLPSGNWKSANPADVLQMGAVSYFFARDLFEKYHVPIGIINASVGGTPIESWISETGFKDFKDVLKTIEKNKDSSYINSFKIRPNVEVKMNDVGQIEHWEDFNYQPKNWRRMNIPGYWDDQGLKDLHGVVWYRKEIELPAFAENVAAKLFMGRIIDADVAFVNGVRVGNITYQYPPRRYNIPTNVLRSGKNIITMRVTNTAGKGGFVTDKPYFLEIGNQKFDLKGDWLGRVGEVFQADIRTSGNFGFSRQNQPSALFNAMVAPIVNQTTIKGMIWYQGESNAGDPYSYYSYLPALIQDWRHQWKENELPFLYVQLPNFQDINYTPGESQWATLRDAQLKALSIPNTAMTVAIDLGEWNDIHPLRKKAIGNRLALAAKHLAYGDKEIIYSGPTLKSTEVENDKIILSFENVGNGIISKDGEPLRWFAVAGDNKKFVWANVKIQGKDKLVVSEESVLHPKYVRYAWMDNPENVNFYNSTGLPASPFKTDEENIDPSKAWLGKKAAIVLTYDDAIDQHLDNALPILNALNLKATFYMTAFSEASKNRINEWRQAAEQGHELGNHTLYHPCIGGPGRSWVSKERDMNNYTIERMINEVRMTNVFLEALDGKKKRTFAFTCGDMKVGNSNFIDSLKNDFVAARAVRNEMHTLNKIDLYNVDCYLVNHHTADQMIEWVKEAEVKNALLVILFHGVGGGNSLNVEALEHKKFLEYLKANESDLMIAPMIEVAEHINHFKANK